MDNECSNQPQCDTDPEGDIERHTGQSQNLRALIADSECIERDAKEVEQWQSVEATLHGVSLENLSVKFENNPFLLV